MGSTPPFRDGGLKTALHLARTGVLILLNSIVTGTAVAVFLWSLDFTTRTRFDHPWLLWTLPLLGGLVGLIYHHFGRSAQGGNNLIIDQIHMPGGGVPRRMAPLVLLGTLLTHLGGGSAGREGTAVQMGGSIAGAVCRHLKLSQGTMRTLLMAGVAAGFGAVFGTPVAGAVFAIEVLTINRLRLSALLPCLVAAYAGDWVCSAWNVHWLGLHFQIHHTSYYVNVPRLEIGLLLKVAIASVAFGLASVLFAQMTHGVAKFFKQTISYPPLRPVIGGAMVVGLTLLLGTREYLGLGLPIDPHHPEGVSLISSFTEGGATRFSWAWKTLFTAITLGSGFKGGEVTPLFFVGATLGNALAMPLHAPVAFFAAVGFVAVFAGATNTPVACTIMAVELFGLREGGPDAVVYFAVACAVAKLCSGHGGIYHAQRRPGKSAVNISPTETNPLPPAASIIE